MKEVLEMTAYQKNSMLNSKNKIFTELSDTILSGQQAAYPKMP